MSFPWYRVPRPGESLDQGDLIFGCPVIQWHNKPVYFNPDGGLLLKDSIDVELVDVVILTQTCDLAQGKIGLVTLAAIHTLDVFRAAWAENEPNKASDKAWAKFMDNVMAGRNVNLCLLNSQERDPHSPHYIVNFHQTFTLPRVFLASFVEQTPARKHSLLPPYREHLSQCYGKFFMRIGSPIDIVKTW